MGSFEPYVLEQRSYNPTFPRLNLIELLEQSVQETFLVDVDMERDMLVVAIPVQSTHAVARQK